MPTANRWSLPTRACCALAIVATVGSLPGGWTMTGEGPQVTDVRRDCDEAHGGTCSVRLASAGGPGFGAVVQRLSAAEYAGRRVVLSGWLKTERAEAAQLWLRVDAGATIVGFDNMDDRPVSGTEPWTRYQLALDVPRNASVVAFGVLLHGSGRAWADDLALTFGDERDVASTDMLPPDKVWRSLSPGPGGLPRRPTNLGFED
jgi:hypothetical protein